MMVWLQLNCDFCDSSIDQPGGLLSTPIEWSKNEHLKQHICFSCSQRANKVLNLNELWTWNAGIYWSPPINPWFWNIHIRMLTWEELAFLKAELKKT